MRFGSINLVARAPIKSVTRSLETWAPRSFDIGVTSRACGDTYAQLTSLLERIDSKSAGIRLYGIAPPKVGTPPERLRDIAAQQVARLRELAPDGLVVYDIQDEPGPAGQERPFPFLPTVDPDSYAYDALADLAIPKIVYRCVGARSRDAFSTWLMTLSSATDRRLSVFVGAPRGRSHSAGLPLADAYTLARPAPNLVFGVFSDVQEYAQSKHLPLGINVESISIRKSEVDASVELYRRLCALWTD